MSKQVIMNAEIKFHFDTAFQMADALDSGKANLDIGDYEFHIGNDNISFGFDADGYNISKDNIVLYETGHGYFFNNYDIDDCNDESYKRIGIQREDITAQYLAGTDEITEFYLNLEDSDSTPVFFVPELLSIWFTDENGVSYPVSQDVIDHYNAKIREECALK